MTRNHSRMLLQQVMNLATDLNLSLRSIQVTLIQMKESSNKLSQLLDELLKNADGLSPEERKRLTEATALFSQATNLLKQITGSFLAPMLPPTHRTH